MGLRRPVHDTDVYDCTMLQIQITDAYGVATIIRLLKIIGLFCKRTL